MYRSLPAFALSLVLALTGAGIVTGGKQSKSSKSKTNSRKKEIAITFDELPAARTFGEVDRKAITYLILDALKQHRVRATGFVIGDQIHDSYDILGEWLNGSHTLGNMTYSGQDYNLLGPDQFIPDITRGAEALEPMLSGFGQKKRYFRFPYLHYGNTVQRRRPVTSYLEDRKFVVVPATVVPEDFVYNLSLSKLGKIPDSSRFEQLMNDYLNHLFDELERVERLGAEITGGRIRQILDLRANRLNAVFLDELLTALEGAGYRFVSLDYALKDPVYQNPEAYYGLKGLGYLDMMRQSDPDLLPAE